MKIIEHRKVTEEKCVVVGHDCDHCGATETGRNEVSLPNGWHEFRAYHRAWGDEYCEDNDHMVCSPYCYIAVVEERVNKFERHEYEGAWIDGMSWSFAAALVAAFHGKALDRDGGAW